jgi:hypothetical protein
MSFTFSDAELERIAAVLDVPAQRDGTTVRFELTDDATGRRLVLEMQTRLELPESMRDGDQPGVLVSAYASNSFLQLHGCTGFLASQELGEVIFFARNDGATSGLVVEREAGCSLYAHVDERLLSADFTKLSPELIMSSVALSMTEALFNDLR